MIVETAEDLSPLKVLRREKILDAAERVFSHNGYRGATMEGIAVAVGISKATLYAYFSDKDAVFVATSERFIIRLTHVLLDAMTKGGPMPEAIASGLVAKYEAAYSILWSSPYARELFATSNEMVLDSQRAMHATVKRILCDAMVSAGYKEEIARDKARLLTNAVRGISDNTHDFDKAVKDIRALVDAVVPKQPD